VVSVICPFSYNYASSWNVAFTFLKFRLEHVVICRRRYYCLTEDETGTWFWCRLLAAKYRPHGVYKDARSILVIHNIAHQVSRLILFHFTR